MATIEGQRHASLEHDCPVLPANRDMRPYLIENELAEREGFGLDIP
jgi:hypothetical protein